MARRKAPNNSGIQPYFRKDRNKWVAAALLGRKPNGSPDYKWVSSDSHEDCARQLRALTAAVDSGTYVEASKMKLKDWLDVWLTEYKNDVKPLTYKSYDTVCRVHIIPNLGNLPLSNIRPHDIQRFINALSKGQKALSSKTIRNVHGVLRAALEQAYRFDYISSNPASKVNQPRVTKKEMLYLADETLNKFLQAIKEHRFERLFYIAVFTGMRQCELLGLSWNSVDFDKGTITVEKQLQKIKKEYKLQPTKNSMSRTLTPPASVMEAFREEKKQQALNQLKSFGGYENPMNLVFTNEAGKHIAPVTLYNSFKRLLKDKGLDTRIRFHDLRHSYAVFSRTAGDEWDVISKSMGHHSAAFTIDTYGHVTEAARLESAIRAEAAIQALIGT